MYVYDRTNQVRVEWTDIGEGYNGEYDPENPDDAPLMRFYVQHKSADGVWDDVEDASYCTQVRVDTEADRLTELAGKILDEVAADVRAGESVKKKCEALSWLPGGVPSWD